MSNHYVCVPDTLADGQSSTSFFLSLFISFCFAAEYRNTCFFIFEGGRTRFFTEKMQNPNGKKNRKIQQGCGPMRTRWRSVCFQLVHKGNSRAVEVPALVEMPKNSLVITSWPSHTLKSHLIKEERGTAKFFLQYSHIFLHSFNPFEAYEKTDPAAA